MPLDSPAPGSNAVDVILHPLSLRLTATAALLCVMGTLCARADTKAEDWRQAALNRESAAIAHQVQADALLVQAEKIRKQAAVAEVATTRARLFVNVGNTRMRAAALVAAAASNLHKAWRDWRQAAQLFKRDHRNEAHEDALKKSADALKACVAACKKSASLYELAGQAFAPGFGDHPRLEARANESAALWRERAAAGNPHAVL